LTSLDLHQQYCLRTIKRREGALIQTIAQEITFLATSNLYIPWLRRFI